MQRTPRHGLGLAKEHAARAVVCFAAKAAVAQRRAGRLELGIAGASAHVGVMSGSGSAHGAPTHHHRGALPPSGYCNFCIKCKGARAGLLHAVLLTEPK